MIHTFFSFQILTEYSSFPEIFVAINNRHLGIAQAAPIEANPLTRLSREDLRSLPRSYRSRHSVTNPELETHRTRKWQVKRKSVNKIQEFLP